MLLRRVTEHVRAQNWFAVAVDFIIVVAGIFVGLQVDDWYQHREDRALEELYLEQIYSEIEFLVSMERRAIELHSEIVDDLEFAIGALKRGELTPAEKTRFKYAILWFGNIAPAPSAMKVFDTLIATGHLSVIQDSWIRNWLVDTATVAKSVQEMIPGVRGVMKLPVSLDEAAITGTPHPSGKGIEYFVSFEMLRDDSRTLRVLAESRFAHMELLKTHQMILENYEEAHMRLERTNNKEKRSLSE